MARGSAWRFGDGVAIAGLLALAVAAALPAWREIVRTGVGNPEQSHILLALPLVVRLGWLRRERARRAGPAGRLRGLAWRRRVAAAAGGPGGGPGCALAPRRC